MNSRSNTRKRRLYRRALALVALTMVLAAASTGGRADTGACNGQTITLPFTDVPASNGFFCQIAQAFFTGLTNGTSATTYNPDAEVTRGQMAAFVTRTQDSALKRSSRRAAAGQWWMPTNVSVLKATSVGSSPLFICADGEDIWVPNYSAATVTRVHASDGRVLGTWTGADGAHNTIAAAGFIYVTAFLSSPARGRIYRIDPSQPPGAVTEVENNLGILSRSITFDGLNLWTANQGVAAGTGSITRYNILTDSETSFGAGFSQPYGIVYDGTALWVNDIGSNEVYRVDPATGSITHTIPLGINSSQGQMVFDGTNVWVCAGNGLTVIRAGAGPFEKVARLTGNGITGATGIAFDGERILVTDNISDVVALWKATSLIPLGFLSTGDAASNPIGVCSDGLNFFVGLEGPDQLVRF